jgi:hypothetical protein
MGRIPRNSATAFLAWWIVRRRLRRSDSLIAPVGLIGLELVGPRLFLIRRTAVLVVSLTIVGLFALAIVWLVLRRRRGRGDDWGGWDEPEPQPEPEPEPADEIEVEEPATPVSA